MEKGYRLDLGTIESLKYELPRVYDLEDRYRHTYIIGRTGSGKSTLMLNMALYDIEHGCSVIFIDPKGDIVNSLNHLVPPEKIVNIGFNNPLTINPLKKKNYNEHDLIGEFIDILKLLITLTTPNPQSISLLMEEIISEALINIKPADRDVDFLYKFLLSKETRDKYFTAKPFYWEEFDRRDPITRWLVNKEKNESAQRISSRLHLLIKDPRLQKIICGRNQLSIANLTREGKVLLVNTSRMSHDARIYISSLVTHAVKSFCEYEKQNEYRPLMVYADEFQTCFSPLFSHLLATSRAYKVGFTLAHQDFGQLSKEMLSSVFGNCNIFVAFNCGYDEARKMAGLFGVTDRDILDLPNYNAYVRIGTQTSLVKTYPLMREVKYDVKLEYNFLRESFFPV